MSRTIEEIPVADLIPYEGNAKKHPKKQIKTIAKSIQAFGFNTPILINELNFIIAGHGRLEAAKSLGMERVPCCRLVGLTEEQQRAFLLADNKTAEGALWDEELLASELRYLLDAENLSFDLDATGFTLEEVDQIVSGVEPEEPGNPEDELVPQSCKRRVERGDIWQIGSHRLICGDALDPAVIKELMGEAKARMVFTDPPYNVPIEGHVSGGGKIKHREFAMASGEMSREQFIQFLEAAMRGMVDHCNDGSILMVCMDWRHLFELQTAGEKLGLELKNLIVWVKPNGGQGSFYRSRHELIFAFKHGSAPHLNNFGLGEGGRYRTNVWTYSGMNSFGAERNEQLANHPTVKPVQMVKDAILDVSGRGDIVLDAFAGTGTTGVAAERTGRVARLIEFDPLYCDVILERLERATKEDAQLIQRMQQ